jgi:hypothetical protein
MAYAPQPPYVQPARTSTLALVSLIAGIVGLFAVPIFGSIVAVVTGHMAKKEIREGGGMVSGDGLATAGLVLGYIGVGIAVLGICAVVLWFLFLAGLFGLTLTQTGLAAILPFA